MVVSVLVLTTGGGTPLSSKLPKSAGSPASDVFEVELARGTSRLESGVGCICDGCRVRKCCWIALVTPGRLLIEITGGAGRANTRGEPGNIPLNVEICCSTGSGCPVFNDSMIRLSGRPACSASRRYCNRVCPCGKTDCSMSPNWGFV